MEREGREVQESNWQVMKAGMEKKACQENLWNVSIERKKKQKQKLDQNDSFDVFIWAGAAAWAPPLFFFELLFTFPLFNLQKELSGEMCGEPISTIIAPHNS